jgi:hypothetical protein
MILHLEGEERLLDPEVLRACLKGGRGYTVAYDGIARARAIEEAVAFLLKAL